MFEPAIIAAWSLAIASFLGLVYLLMTWPTDRDEQATSNAASAGSRRVSTAGVSTALDFPEQLAMDSGFQRLWLGDYGAGSASRRGRNSRDAAT